MFHRGVSNNPDMKEFLRKEEMYRTVGRAMVKALLLFVVLNFIFAIWYPMPALGRVSAYNSLFPGRQRLPYGDVPEKSYNLSLFNLEAMFASHELASGSKPEDEFRVLLIGDSSTWGFLLPVEETLSSQLNSLGVETRGGRDVRVYNLGYPVMSLTKDLLLLSYGMRYQPDLIVWLVTLESFPVDKQLFPDLLLNNPGEARDLASAHGLAIDIEEASFVDAGTWDRSIVGGRRGLADWLRLQLYGVMWAATGIDQDIPEDFTPRMEDLPADDDFHNFTPPDLREDDLALDVLQAGVDMAGEIPVLIVNEPMFISQGENSDLRYNFYYPRWVYDEYRELMAEQSDQKGWIYSDMWDIIPPSEFTNSAIHMSPEGVRIFAEKLMHVITQLGEEAPASLE